LGKLVDVVRVAKEIAMAAQPSASSDTMASLSLGAYLATEAAVHVAGPWSRWVAQAISSRMPGGALSKSGVETIVTSTVSGVVEGGFEEFLGWGVGN
jgi:hypothetical protein